MCVHRNREEGGCGRGGEDGDGDGRRSRRRKGRGGREGEEGEDGSREGVSVREKAIEVLHRCVCFFNLGS